ncbi:MAG: ABC transporter ATP-binding protein [Pseudomonadales bacterium]|nr:ABC transporter ATP-binding protein [Pseudomonadales bacterium]
MIADTAGSTVLSISDLRFRWPAAVRNLLDIEAFAIASGESVFLQGASGSGKSTLLNLVAGVLAPDAGRISLLGADLTSASGAQRDRLRADHVGFVFQQFNLLPYLSVVDNVLLPLRFSRRRVDRCAAAPGGAVAEAQRLLEALGLEAAARRARDVTELSVGQQQRVALARGLVGRPELLIADEPTSSLDADARDDFLALLDAERAAAGAALLFVSHDAGLAARFDRSVALASLNGAEETP